MNIPFKLVQTTFQKKIRRFLLKKFLGSGLIFVKHLLSSFVLFMHMLLLADGERAVQHESSRHVADSSAISGRPQEKARAFFCVSAE